MLVLEIQLGHVCFYVRYIVIIRALNWPFCVRVEAWRIASIVMATITFFSVPVVEFIFMFAGVASVLALLHSL